MLSPPRAWKHDDDTRHTWAIVSRLAWVAYDFLIVFVFVGIITPWGILVANHDIGYVHHKHVPDGADKTPFYYSINPHCFSLVYLSLRAG